MERISISDLYRGEGLGEMYGGILNAVFQEVFNNGIPEGCDERTWIELLTVKHTFLVAERMQKEGDVVSELSEAASPFCVSEKEAALCSGAQCAPQNSAGSCSGAHRAPLFPIRMCSGTHRAPEDQDRDSAPPTPDETRRGVTE